MENMKDNLIIFLNLVLRIVGKLKASLKYFLIRFYF